MSNNKTARFQFSLINGEQPDYFAVITMKEVLTNNPNMPGTVEYITEVHKSEGPGKTARLLFTVPFHCDPDICRCMVAIYLAGIYEGEGRRAEDTSMTKPLVKQFQDDLVKIRDTHSASARALNALANAIAKNA